MARRARRHWRRRIPAALLKIYGDRVWTLRHAILSLLPHRPSSPSLCSCLGRRCLACVRRPHLLRDGDSPSYRRLLSRSFCVLSPDSPPPPHEFLASAFTQRQIVENTLKLMMGEQISPKNVLCNGYNNVARWSPNVELVSTSTWDLLLSRIGDPLMVFLLQFSSIFIPLMNKSHHQVTGIPIDKILSMQNSSLNSSNFSKKRLSGHASNRSQVDFEERNKDINFHVHQPSGLFGVNDSTNSIIASKMVGMQEKDCQNYGRQISLPECDKPVGNKRKRGREFSWYRRSKKKKMTYPGEQSTAIVCQQQPDTTSPISCGDYTEMASVCFHCSMLQAAQKINMRAYIERRQIFYSRSSSYLLFPRDHILNRLKPNDADAANLMEKIFGFPHGGPNYSFSCNLLTKACSIRSKCLYHFLLRLLKSIIRNAQRCQYRKLLDKHCKSPTIKKFQKLHEKTHENTAQQFDLVGSCCSNEQVVSFIWAVTRNIIPPDMFGGSSTWRALRKNIAKFVRLRRFEKFSIKECIHGLKTSSFTFLDNIRKSECYCKDKNKSEGGGMKNNPLNVNWEKLNLHSKFIQSWIYWLFSYILTPMIASNFYVTEKEHGKQDVFYYLKPVWRSLVGGTVACLRKRTYKLVDKAYVRQVLAKRNFGSSKVRFLPKEKNLRPLANLKAPSKLRFSNQEFTRNCFSVGGKCVAENSKSMKNDRRGMVTCSKSVNSALHELYAILRSIMVKDPDKLGSSVFDYNDIYQKLYHFLFEIRKGHNMMHKIYIVIADVSKAFDSIDQDILINIMKGVIKDNEYVVRKYARVICKKSPIALFKQVSFDESGIDFDVRSFQAATQLCSTHGIFADKGIIKKIKQQNLHYLLNEHVKHNILQVDGSFYEQKLGISQGSLVSTLLCSLYYGNLEKNMIYPYLENTHQSYSKVIVNEEESVIDRCTGEKLMVELFGNAISGIQPVKDDEHCTGKPRKHDYDEDILLSGGRHECLNYGTNTSSSSENECASPPKFMLLRLIDDYLFVSTSEMQATSFFNMMREGFKEYNCSMNDEKFCLNFEIGGSEDKLNRIYTGADGVSFLPWSGLFINSQTLEIQADYMRYWGAHLRSTISIHAHSRPFYNLRAKLCAYMRPKCHPIFYDSNINSLATVGLNAYQAFLLCAMKFHCYVCGLPTISHLDPNYFLQMIQYSFSYFYQLIEKQMHDMELRFHIQPVHKLKKAEYLWLGLSAYIRVLKKKQSRHKELLSLLRSKLASHWRIVEPLPHLRYAVDDSHSSVFWKIKY
ncbi:hypothetical protein J5N97_020335 [Dioscorea zingiberensis]|uniref:Telomerase reverse transcriptase n=1 Tax=Dioscorea zingiberensis TaxID=325984 RepID=A0A9D5HD50_9LILI|nr:hypothetical protein J5N97_020335 [Dioscorea zingiberensis]